MKLYLSHILHPVEKQAGLPIGQMLRSWQPLGHAKYIPKLLATGLVAPYIGETAYKTVDNIHHGDWSIGRPTWTGKQVATGIGYLGELTHINAGLAAGAHLALSSLDSDSNAQKLLGNAATTTGNLSHITQAIADPGTRDAAKQVLVNAATDSASNVARSAGQSLGHGMLEGMGDEVIKHPVSTLGWTAALGAGPVALYDLVNRRKKMKQEATNNAILRYILRNEKKQQPVVQKTAGLLSSIIPKAISKPVSGLFHANPFFLEGGWADRNLSKLPKWMYQNTVLPPSAENIGSHIQNLQKVSPGIDNQRIQDLLLGKYPSTLINNSLTRNPTKSMILTSGLGGAGMSAAKDVHDTFSRTGPNPGIGDLPLHMAKGYISGSIMLPRMELAAMVQNDKYKSMAASPTVKAVGDVVKNLKDIKHNAGQFKEQVIDPAIQRGADATVKNAPPLAIAANQKLTQTAQAIKDPQLAQAIHAGAQPSKTPWYNSLHNWLVENKTNPNVLIPAGGAAVMSPILAHAAYKRFGEKKLHETTSKNEGMRRELEQLDR